jgi:glycosyltransferase involved in cell wall biosynthesis
MYVRLLVEFSRKQGIDTALAMPAVGFESPEFGIHLSDIATEFTHVPIAAGLSAHAIKLSLAQTAATRLILVDGDSSLMAAMRFRSGGSTGHSAVLLVMRDPRVHPDLQSGSHRVRQLAKRAMAELVHATGRADVVYLRSSVAKGRDPRTVPDPIAFRSSADGQRALRAEWDLNPDVRWVSVLGSITARKNVALVAEAIQLTGDRACGLLVAGKLDEVVVPQIHRAAEMLRARGYEARIVARLLTTEELDDAIATSDVCVMAHSNEGPSGLMGKAVTVGTRVVASGAQSLRRDADSHSGVLWVPLNPEDIASALTRSLTMPRPTPHISDTAERFCRRLVLG